MKLRSVIAGAALIAGVGMAAAAPAQAAITQNQDGTTCVTDHRETAAWTNCSGGSGTWKIYVECDWQADHTGDWHTGGGSDSYECWNEVLGANVRWR
ncbi:hypothetical protein ACPFP2_05470 [Micromonospora citrea]|uniref:hypothetical protein n=1 Tax=Micromonospora citrea TaxID=47855 RepID=UPI003C5C5FB7